MEFTQEHEGIRRNVKKFIDTEINPHVDEWEEAGIFPAHERVQEDGRPGLSRHQQARRSTAAWGSTTPTRWSFLEALGHIRLRRRADGDRRADRHGDAGARALRLGRAVQASSSRPSIAGDYVACLGVSARSAPAPTSPRIKTTARKDGGDYVINGGKMWITNGTQADWMCLLANTCEGPRAQEQVADLRADEDQGRRRSRASSTSSACAPATPAQIFFEDVRVPQRNRIGEEGMGFIIPDAAVPGGAAVRRGRRCVGMERLIDADHRLLARAPDVRPADPRQPGRALPPGRAARPRSRRCAR